MVFGKLVHGKVVHGKVVTGKLVHGKLVRRDTVFTVNSSTEVGKVVNKLLRLCLCKIIHHWLIRQSVIELNDGQTVIEGW